MMDFVMRWWQSGEWLSDTFEGRYSDAKTKRDATICNGGSSVELFNVDHNGNEHVVVML